MSGAKLDRPGHDTAALAVQARIDRPKKLQRALPYKKAPFPRSHFLSVARTVTHARYEGRLRVSIESSATIAVSKGESFASTKNVSEPTSSRLLVGSGLVAVFPPFGCRLRCNILFVLAAGRLVLLGTSG